MVNNALILLKTSTFIIACTTLLMITDIDCQPIVNKLLEKYSMNTDLNNKIINCIGKLNEEQQEKFMKRGQEMKKNIFLSRGWGAGGMPFSVLYMNPTFSSHKISSKQSLVDSKRLKNKNAKNLPQLRTSMQTNNRQVKNSGRLPQSVIPQLFVSYGWGPLGQR